VIRRLIRDAAEAGVPGTRQRRDDDHQDDGLSGNDPGDGPRRGRRQEPRPAGREPYGRGARRLAGVPASAGPVAARRYVPTGTGLARKAAVDRRCHAVRVQQWTAIAGLRGSQTGSEGPAARRSRQHCRIWPYVCIEGDAAV
jgi:hypothetical protein